MAPSVSSIPQRSPKPLGIVSEIGPVFKNGEQILRPLYVLDEHRILTNETLYSRPNLLLAFMHSLCRTRIDRLTAPHTELILTRSVALAPRPRDRSDQIRFGIIYVEAVTASEFVVDRDGENRDVPGSNPTPTGLAVMILERSLIHPSAHEEATDDFRKFVTVTGFSIWRRSLCVGGASRLRYSSSIQAFHDCGIAH
jgi:hypothetical protein